MTRELKFGRKEALSGETKSVMVFVHGYGADGADLLGLGDPLAPHFPNTTFIAPDAPERSAANPMGYQWFPIPWLDGSSEEAARDGLMRAAEDLNAFLDQVLETEGVAPSAMALVGFSQGTMMSLEVAPRRAEPVAAVVGFSGRLLRSEALATDAVSRPPVLLLHGDQDEVVPPASMPAAAEALHAAEFEVATFVMQGTGHGISPDGLSAAASFLHPILS